MTTVFYILYICIGIMPAIRIQLNRRFIVFRSDQKGGNYCEELPILLPNGKEVWRCFSGFIELDIVKLIPIARPVRVRCYSFTDGTGYAEPYTPVPKDRFILGCVMAEEEAMAGSVYCVTKNHLPKLI